MQPVATLANLVSPGFSPLCCVYPIQQLSGVYNNSLVNGFPVVTIANFYGTRFNVNICNQFCPPDFLVPVGISNSLSGNVPKAKLGDAVGSFGGRIIGTPSKLLIL